MTLEITETKAVIFYGDVYLINGLEIIKTNQEGTSFEFVEGGVKYYMNLLEKLNSLIPIKESERLSIINKIKSNVKKLK